MHQSSENGHLPSYRRTSRRNEASGMKFAAQVPEPSQPKGASEAARLVARDRSNPAPGIGGDGRAGKTQPVNWNGVVRSCKWAQSDVGVEVRARARCACPRARHGR